MYKGAIHWLMTGMLIAGLCGLACGAELRVGVYGGLGDAGIIAALNAAEGIKAHRLEGYSPDTLSALDAVIIPHGDRIAVHDGVRPWRAILRRYVEMGGGIVLTHNAVGYRGLFAGGELFGEIETAIPRTNVPGGGGGRKDAWTFKPNPASKNPLTAKLPATIRHGYCDHVAMHAGPLGQVVCVDDDGDATVVTGEFGQGRVVAIGALLGVRSKVQDLKRYDEEIAAPEGAERALLVESVRWAAAGAGRDRAAMKAALDKTADKFEGQAVVVFSSNFEGYNLSPDEWIVPPDPDKDHKTWRGHGLGVAGYGQVGEVFLHDQPLAARPFKKGDISGAFVLTFDALKSPMFGGTLDVALTNPEGWGYGVRLVYVSESDPGDATNATRTVFSKHKLAVGAAVNGVFRIEKGAVTMLAEAGGKDARLRMPATGGAGVPVRFERAADGWLTLRVDGRVIAAARDTTYDAFSNLALTLKTPNGRLAVDNLKLAGFYTDVALKVYEPPPPVLPQPKELELTGAKFVLVDGAQFVVDDKNKIETYCLEEFIEDIAGFHGVRLRAVERGKEDAALPVIDLAELSEPAPGLGTEGYSIEVTGKRAQVRGATEKATFYGMCSLYQLIAREGTNVFIRGATIRDWPDLEWRGAHTPLIGDTGLRGHVAVLKNQIKMLARLKANVFLPGSVRLPFPSYPLISGYDCAWTMDEYADIVRYARAHHLDVWARVCGLSHSGWKHFLPKKEPAFWKWVKEHKVLGAPEDQNPHADAFNPASPEAVELIFKTGDDVIRATGVKTVFIGMDEIQPHLSKMVPGRDPAEVLAEYINKHHAHLKAQGVRMALWVDSLLEFGKYEGSCASSGSAAFPDVTHRALDMIPKDIILADWFYATKPGRPSYAYLKSKGFDVVGMPGTCYGNLYDSIYNSTVAAKKAGIKGIIEYEWDTGAHFNPQISPILPMVYGWAAPDKMAPDWSESEVWQRLYQGPRPSDLGRVGPLDIGRAMNESRADERADDGEGWFDYGRNADFSTLPSGELVYRHLRFMIADEKKNGGKGAVVVATPDARAKAPLRVTGIGVNAKVKSLIFLHIATEGPHSRDIGAYVVHFDDGTTAQAPIVYGQNIGPWLLEQGHTSGFYGAFYKHGYLSESLLAYSGGTRSGERVALQAYEWVNPHPDKTIQTIDLVVADPGGRTYARNVRIALLAISAVQ